MDSESEIMIKGKRKREGEREGEREKGRQI